MTGEESAAGLWMGRKKYQELFFLQSFGWRENYLSDHKNIRQIGSLWLGTESQRSCWIDHAVNSD